jgi:hypothetical protein
MKDSHRIHEILIFARQGLARQWLASAAKAEPEHLPAGAPRAPESCNPNTGINITALDHLR